jgi:hypothetical protein
VLGGEGGEGDVRVGADEVHVADERELARRRRRLALAMDRCCLLA